MSEPVTARRRPLGAPSASLAAITPPELGLMALAAGWLGVGLFLHLRAEAPIAALALIAEVLFPALVFAGAAFGVRHLRLVQAETAALRAELEALRQETLARRQASAASLTRAAAAAPAPRAPAPPPRVQTPAPARAAGDAQPSLALETAGTEVTLRREEFIRALNFPDGADDHEGIRCLRLALEHHEAARLIRAAQDVLTLLAQDGIYMDDLQPEPAPADLWRRFAGGERGASVAPIGGVNDRSSLALTAGRMRSDAVFRDAAHHFLRQFDRSLATFGSEASDQDLIDLSDTRTARAFMLFGRVAGVFD